MEPPILKGHGETFYREQNAHSLLEPDHEPIFKSGTVRGLCQEVRRLLCLPRFEFSSIVLLRKRHHKESRRKRTSSSERASGRGTLPLRQRPFSRQSQTNSVLIARPTFTPLEWPGTTLPLTTGLLVHL